MEKFRQNKTARNHFNNCLPEPNVTDTDVSDTLQCRKAEDMETAILIGASNTKKLALNDDNLPINIYPCSKGVTKLWEVASRVEKCNFKPEKVHLVVVYLGSCDFSMEPDGSATSAKQVYAEYIEALNAISSKFNQAEIAMASIPSRETKWSSEITKQTGRKSFIDNTELYWEGDQVRSSVFRDHIHLDIEGQKLLNARLLTGIRDAYYKPAHELGCSSPQQLKLTSYGQQTLCRHLQYQWS